MSDLQALAPCWAGVNLDILFLGFILSQFVYWKLKCESTEKWPLRLFMYWSVFACMVHSGYVQAFGGILFLTSRDHSLEFYQGWWFKGLLLFELFIAGPVELVYAWRAYALWSRPPWLRIYLFGIFTMFVVVGAVNIATPDPGIGVIRTPKFMLWIAVYLVLECSLTVLIVTALYRKRSGLGKSDRLLRRIIILSAEAQLVPVLAAVVFIIWTKVVPDSTNVFAFLCAPKIWVMTCNIVINSRRGLQKHVETERQMRQNRLNTLPELFSTEPPTSPDTQPSAPHLSSYPSGSSKDKEKDFRSISGISAYFLPKEPTRPSQSVGIDEEDMALEDLGWPYVNNAISSSKKGDVQAQNGDRSVNVHSAPELQVGYVPRPPLATLSRYSSGAGRQHGEMSFEEMLRHTTR